MTGRKGLTWVTALTMASLLLGGGALNALANGHGGGDHGGGNRGKPEHQQQSPAQVNHGNNVQHQNSEDNNGNQNKDKDVDRNGNDDQAVDLVTPPARVTDEDRPGLGCGDDNHTHTGPPGNPDKECNSHADDNGDEQGVTDDVDDADEG
jgi:hypothetical protein